MADLVAGELEAIRQRAFHFHNYVTGVPSRVTLLPDDFDWLLARVGLLVERNQQLEAELDAAQLRSIEVSNPGINADEVRRMRERARIVADIDEYADSDD